MSRWGELVAESEWRESQPKDVQPPDIREARRIVNEYDCTVFGHSWAVIETVQTPVKIVCERCGKSHVVQAD